MEAQNGIPLGEHLAAFLKTDLPHGGGDLGLLFGGQLAEQGQEGNELGNVGALNGESPVGMGM
ncbi:hypothetical protein DLREEDagrD3_06770 [Denitratisoma sp. agr-D3]